MSSKDKPAQFDCYANALPDEEMFVLLARDPYAPKLVEDWAREREDQILRGERPASDKAMADEARKCAFNMARWRDQNLGKWRKPSGEE